MSYIKKVSIPETCSQSWMQMSVTREGRHCQHCCKTVIDFTAMSSKQIINYLSTHKNVCGRFGDKQIEGLNNDLSIEDKNIFSWKTLAATFSIIGLLVVAKSEARTRKVFLRSDFSFHTANGMKMDTVRSANIKGAGIVKKDSLEMRDISKIILNDTTIRVTSTLGGLIVVRQSLPKRIWYKIKRIF